MNSAFIITGFRSLKVGLLFLVILYVCRLAKKFLRIYVEGVPKSAEYVFSAADKNSENNTKKEASLTSPNMVYWDVLF